MRGYGVIEADKETDLGRTFYVRFGSGGSVRPFEWHSGWDIARGTQVVVETHRGLELGEVLGAACGSLAAAAAEQVCGPASARRILRLASLEDLAVAAANLAQEPRRYAACERIFLEGTWPILVVDSETLLDGRTILHYLGPHALDMSGLRERLRERLSLDVDFEPAGRDLDGAPSGDPGGIGCGAGCGSGGCGADLGSGGEETAKGGCGTHSGCSSCTLSRRGHERMTVA
jgi:hypothetical protein